MLNQDKLIRKIDDLGRVSIPKDLRNALGLHLGDDVTTVLDTINGTLSVVIQKCLNQSKLDTISQMYADVLFNTTHEKIVICDTRTVLASCPAYGAIKGDIISDDLSERIKVSTMPSYKYYGDFSTFIVGCKEICAIYPIVNNGNSIGAILVLGSHPIDNVTHSAIKAVVNCIEAQI